MMIMFACALFGATATSVYAGDGHHHAMAEAQKSHAVKGEVVAVDKAASKVKLKHAAVPELKWPAMTMFFAVTDKSQLEGLNAGDRVSFEFIEASDGAPLITHIKPLK
ncbi:copper-binding protein [Georgfuchsia toluolica]|nr:copper-binding protein [Georgfuchsia toluolica]